MGLLSDVRTGERVVLRAEHVFGRNPSRADTALADPDISAMHAVAQWREGRWMLFDHSRNGTFVDDRALVRGEACALAFGQLIRLGLGSTAVWRVMDTSAPVNVLVPVDGSQPLITLAAHNLLPTGDAPELSIYETQPGQWVVDQDGETRALKDGDPVQFAGAGLHRFIAAAPPVDDTRVVETDGGVAAPCLVMRLSLDEEHARLEVKIGTAATDLGERSHHYCLATLARRRLADQQRGLEPGAQGWLGSAELARMLGMEATHLNMQIFRAREQLMTALPGLAPMAGLIERRRGELRIGEIAFEIYRGDGLEGRYLPGMSL